jgi:hypothetical protein
MLVVSQATNGHICGYEKFSLLVYNGLESFENH